MKLGTIAVLGLLAAVSVAQAQGPRRSRIEVRPFAAAYSPTGNQGRDFNHAATFGFIAAVELTDHAHILGSGSWTDGTSKIGGLSSDQAQIWQYDLGVEFNAMRPFATRYLWKPFVGAGLGARSYKYDLPGIGSSTCAAGYTSFGSEVQRSAVALRLEARGYLSCFKQPWTGERFFRNDFSFMFGLAYHIT